MTNVIESLVAYTNIAFQLMLSDVSRTAQALKLPLPQPVSAQIVSQWKVTSLEPEVSGELSVSNFSFYFQNGYLARFLDRSNAISIRQQRNPLAHIDAFRSRTPPTMTEEQTAILTKVQKRLATLGVDTTRLGEGRAQFISRMPSPRYWVWWTTNGERVLRLELMPNGEDFTGLEFSDYALPIAWKQKVALDQGVPPTIVAVFSNAVAVACGIDSASDDQVHRAVRDCFEGLRAKTGRREIRRVIVEDNLGRKDLVAADLAGMINDPIYIAIDWTNPPPPFPADKIANAARGRRGISMAAITGGVEIKAMPAPFFKTFGPEPTQPKAREEATAAYVPAARDFIKTFEPRGPATANVLFLIPPSGGSGLRQQALFTAGKDRFVYMTSSFEAAPTHYTTSFGGNSRVDEPILLLLSGAFNWLEEDNSLARREPRPMPMAPLQELLPFHEHPLTRTYQALGDTGLQILTKAKQVETFRLWLVEERHSRDLSRAEQIDGQAIRYKGPKPDAKIKNQLADMILQEIPHMQLLTMCIYDPGVAFRLSASEGSITMLVCFNCADLSWTVRDPSGKTLTGGSLRPDDATMNQLRKIGLKAFPTFKQLKERHGE